MDERRNINRVNYKANSIIVLCDSNEKVIVEVDDVSPKGMGITSSGDIPDYTGKDIIIITDTLIMYAAITRQTKLDNGKTHMGIQAKQFTPQILEYLFDCIGSDAEEM